MILHFFLTRGTAQLTWQLIYTSSFLVTVPLHFWIITPHISTPFQVDTVNTILMFCPIQFYLLSDSSSCFPVCLVPCRLCTYTCGQKNMQMLNIFMCEHDSPVSHSVFAWGCEQPANDIQYFASTQRIIWTEYTDSLSCICKLKLKSTDQCS